MHFILASSSSIKLSLLVDMGYRPNRVIPHNIDQNFCKKELPRDYIKRITLQKTLTIHQKFLNSIVLSTATVISRGRLILKRPQTKDDACSFFKFLSGRRYSVLTGLCVIKEGKAVNKIIQTKLKFKLLTDGEIQNLATFTQHHHYSNQYLLQGFSSACVSWISGHPSNIIGFPIQ